MFATDTICFEPSSLLWLKVSQFPALFMLAIAMAESKIHKKAHTHLQSKKSQLNFYCDVRVSPPYVPFPTPFIVKLGYN